MRETKSEYNILVENLKGRDLLADLSVDEKLIKPCLKEKRL
jgi:hypothetical protein